MNVVNQSFVKTKKEYLQFCRDTTILWYLRMFLGDDFREQWFIGVISVAGTWWSQWAGLRFYNNNLLNNRHRLQHDCMQCYTANHNTLGFPVVISISRICFDLISLALSQGRIQDTASGERWLPLCFAYQRLFVSHTHWHSRNDNNFFFLSDYMHIEKMRVCSPYIRVKQSLSSILYMRGKMQS